MMGNFKILGKVLSFVKFPLLLTLQGIIADPSAELHESGAALALKALGWGSLFAVSGVGVLIYGACKLIGVHNVSTGFYISIVVLRGYCTSEPYF